MKKNIIFSILIPAFCVALSLIISAILFSACADNSSNNEDDEEDYSVDVLYSTDWKYVSIYLEGSAPINVLANKNMRSYTRADERAGYTSARTERAMTPDTVRRGLDYFEVFFLDSRGIVRRAAWELGKKASIMDVKDNSGISGVDYSVTSVTHINAGSNNGLQGGNSVGKPDPRYGAAVLFAGKKNDKTLLAVGKLVSVDADEPVEDTSNRTTFINNSTVFVTFELSALKANTSADIKASSFLTDITGAGSPSAANTTVINALIGDKRFPLYMLPGGKKKINAQYSFGIDGDWSDFSDSLFLMDKGAVHKRQARYPAGGGKYWYAKYSEDQTTVIKMTNNQSSWTPPPKDSDGSSPDLKSEFQNPVTFEIDTSETVHALKKDNGIFTFSFEIPVYAISPIIPKDKNDCWYIRPAYMSYYYNIDNGNTTGDFTDKNIGGAVLCAVDLDEAAFFEIPADRR